MIIPCSLARPFRACFSSWLQDVSNLLRYLCEIHDTKPGTTFLSGVFPCKTVLALSSPELFNSSPINIPALLYLSAPPVIGTQLLGSARYHTEAVCKDSRKPLIWGQYFLESHSWRTRNPVNIQLPGFCRVCVSINDLLLVDDYFCVKRFKII